MNIFKKYLNHKKRYDHYEDWLREKGVSIGKNAFISPEYSVIDLFSPFLITIGDNVCVASDVKILTHDYARSVVVRKTGHLYGGAGPVTIGNNVYIAMGCTIVRNTTIGDNIIIGANSLVKGNIESNSVYAGNPARKICSIEEYEQKLTTRQYDEAVQIVKAYEKKFGVMPSETIFRKYDYFMLWSTLEEHKERVTKSYHTRDCSLVYEKNKGHKPMFSSYNEFLKSIKI